MSQVSLTGHSKSSSFLTVSHNYKSSRNHAGLLLLTVISLSAIKQAARRLCYHRSQDGNRKKYCKGKYCYPGYLCCHRHEYIRLLNYCARVSEASTTIYDL